MHHHTLYYNKTLIHLLMLRVRHDKQHQSRAVMWHWNLSNAAWCFLHVLTVLPERHPVSAPLVCKCLTSHHRGLWCSCWLQRCSWEGCMSNQSGKRQSAKREKVESSKTTGGAENATGLKEQWQNRIVCMESWKSTLHDFFRIHWRLKVAEQQIVSVFPFTANPYRRLISLWNRDGSWHNFSSLALFFFLSLFLSTLSLSTSPLLKVAACVKSQYVVIGVSINHSDMPRSLISGESLFGKTQRSREINFLCLNWPTAQSKEIVPILILLSGILGNVLLYYVWVYMWEGTVKTACVQ